MIIKTMENAIYRDGFSRMGYDVELFGAGLFESMLNEVRMLLDTGLTEEEIKAMLPDYYREDFHFYFEVGEKEYFKQLKEFCSSKKSLKKEASIRSRKELGVLPKKNINVDESLLHFAKYFNGLENLYEDTKVMVKTPTSGIITNM